MVKCDSCNLDIVVFQGMSGEIKCPRCNAVVCNPSDKVCLEISDVERTLLKQTELLSPMGQRVLRLYYGLEDGICRTTQEIATILGFTTTQIEEIHTNVLRSMRKLLSKGDEMC